MKLLQVKEFNRQANARCDKAQAEHKHGNGGFPFRPMYLFLLDDGNERQKGWVATEGQKHCFGMNKEKAIAKFYS